jgi:elongation factor Ts
MTVTAEHIKDLRHRTGAGLMDCKKALSETNGDMEKAVEHLRKKGLADIAKRAGKTTNEGAASVKISPDGKIAAAAALQCETDFVAKTDDFKKLLCQITDYAFENPDITNFKQDKKITEMISLVAPKVGENITLKAATVYKLTSNGVLNYYIHSDNKNFALVEISCDDKIADKTAELKSIAKELALQIVAMKPQWVKPQDIDQNTLEKEKEIYRTQILESGKPKKAVEKILEGKLRKFYQHVCLLEQESIRESKMKVKDYLKKQADALGGQIIVVRFARF